MELGRGDPEYEAVEPGEWSIVDAEARAYVRRATREVASLVRKSYGPLGMEKQLRTVDRKDNPEAVHTSDAGEILDGIQRAQGFTHPAAALFVDAVDSMQRGLRDGATTAILLTDALVDRGLDLVEEGVHPGTVVVGYAIAAARAGEVLDDLARPVQPDDAALLHDIAATAMAGEVDDPTCERYAELVADAVGGLAAVSADWLDTDDVKVLAGPGEPGGLTRGLIVRRYQEELGAGETAEREQNWSIRDKVDWEFDWSPMEPRENATVALLDREIDFERSATSFGGDGTEENLTSGVEIRSAEDLQAYRAGRDDRYAETADRLQTSASTSSSLSRRWTRRSPSRWRSAGSLSSTRSSTRCRTSTGWLGPAAARLSGPSRNSLRTASAPSDGSASGASATRSGRSSETAPAGCSHWSSTPRPRPSVPAASALSRTPSR
ncbi:MAG: chaperonin GroEL (HSP60 family) [uncultured archaeon A07HR67]|nr:MAG: chaperonin GroEL (HSP60 family) [uncultured archaeon A07HR67]